MKILPVGMAAAIIWSTMVISPVAEAFVPALHPGKIKLSHHSLGSYSTLSSSTPTFLLARQCQSRMFYRCERRPQASSRLLPLMAAAAPTLDELVAKIQAAGAIRKGPEKLFKAIKKANGAQVVLAEFAREGTARHKLETISLAFRRNNAAAIIVDTACPYEGGEDDLREIVAEQRAAKGKFPGPTGVVWRGNVKDLQSVARAAMAGASGVALPAENMSKELLTQMIHACHALDMEAFVEVTDQEHIGTAVAAGARVICIRFTSKAVASFLNYAQVQLRPDIPAECAAVATIMGRQQGSEAQEAQQVLQQGKFDGVLLSNFVSDALQPLVDRYIAYVFKEVLTKRSEVFKINEMHSVHGSAAVGWGAGAGREPPPGFGGGGTHV